MTVDNERIVRVAHLTIKNIMGIEHADIRPGVVTLVRGQNGAGKTTILEAVKAVLKGGHDATLLRAGSTSGEIVMVLDDGVELRKKITASKSDLQVNHPDHGRLPKPAPFLDNLRDAFSVNPIDFLVAKPKDRVELVLAAIPMKVSAIDLAGVKDLVADPINFDQHALAVLATVHKDIFDQRTNTSRMLKEKNASIAEFRRSMPPESAGEAVDWNGQIRTMEDSRGQIVDRLNQDIELRSHDLAAVIESITTDCTDQIRKVGQYQDREIERLRTEIARVQTACADDIRFIEQKRNGKLDEEKQDAMDDITQLKAVAEPLLANIKDQITTAAVHAKDAERAEIARQSLKQMNSRVAELETETEAFTKALGEIGNIRGNLLEKLPIKGMEMRDGDIFIDGIPFDRVNESRRVRLALDIAMMRVGRLPFICCDGIERLDEKSLLALSDAAEEMKVQLLLAEVSEGPLDVKNLA